MKRTIVVTIASLAALLLALPAVAAVGHAAPHPASAGPRSGPITIESWLHATPSATGLSGTVTACFKLQGAFVDQGGGPTWTTSTYSDTTNLAGKCGDWTPVGGFVFVPPTTATSTLSTVYAVHTVTGQKGQFWITFSGTYDLVNTYQGSGTWVITGGTGAYTGVQGEGTWTADATQFPYIRHTETGQMTRGSLP